MNKIMLTIYVVVCFVAFPMELAVSTVKTEDKVLHCKTALKLAPLNAL